jgi:hypothetical protein
MTDGLNILVTYSRDRNICSHASFWCALLLPEGVPTFLHHRLPPICIKHPSILQVLGGRPIGAPRVGVPSEADSYLALAGQTIKEIAVEGTTGIVSGGVAGIVVSD